MRIRNWTRRSASAASGSPRRTGWPGPRSASHGGWTAEARAQDADRATAGSEPAAPGDRLWEPGPGAPTAAPDPGSLVRLRARAEREDRPRDWLALGAALLAAGDWEGASGPLERSLEAAEAEPDRADASYDLALVHAVAGRPSGRSRDAEGGEATRERLLRARDGFRAVLRADPAAEDARWNLEVVERWLRRQEDAAGGSSGASGAAGGGADDTAGSGAEELPQPMTPEEAQRLLDAAAGDERAVQARRLERNRSRDPVVERNW